MNKCCATCMFFQIYDEDRGQCEDSPKTLEIERPKYWPNTVFVDNTCLRWQPDSSPPGSCYSNDPRSI